MFGIAMLRKGARKYIFSSSSVEMNIYRPYSVAMSKPVSKTLPATLGTTLGHRPLLLALTQVRNMGITDKLMGMATSRLDKTKEEKFSEMLRLMVDTPKWTLKSWKTTMDSQLDSWTQYIPGVSGTKEMQELKSFKSMLDAMSAAELEDAQLIKGPQRERIARSAGKPVDEVQKLIFYYKQSVVIASWLQMKKAAKEPLPVTETDLHEMQAKDPRMKAIAQKVMMEGKKHVRTGRGRRMPF